VYVPPGLTEAHVLAVIEKVSGRLARKFAFACFTAEDLQQQCFVWALERLPQYEPGRPLENFLQVVLANELRNLRRNKLRRAEVPCKACDAGSYCSPAGPCRRHLEWTARNKAKADLMYPIDLAAVNEEEEGALQTPDAAERVEFSELAGRIDTLLPPALRADFLRMADGAVVSSERRRIVRDAVRDILAGRGEAHG
jgi:DNA-directed RNA polymerase specialized sigma24 family protein